MVLANDGTALGEGENGMVGTHEIALVTLTGEDDWHVSYHQTEAAANKHAERLKPPYDEGWVIAKIDDFTVGENIMTLSQLNLLISKFISPEHVTDDLEEAQGRAFAFFNRHGGVDLAPGGDPITPDADSEDPAATEEEGEKDMVQAQTATGDKPKAPKKVAKKVAPAKKAAVAKKVAPAKKAAAPKKAAAAKNGAKAGSPVGQRGVSDLWKKVLAALGKAGADGMNTEALKKACEKQGVAPYWDRFIKAGMITRPSRGVYVLTAAGKKEAGE
jgi:hypothetical protein